MGLFNIIKSGLGIAGEIVKIIEPLTVSADGSSNTNVGLLQYEFHDGQGIVGINPYAQTVTITNCETVTGDNGEPIGYTNDTLFIKPKHAYNAQLDIDRYSKSGNIDVVYSLDFSQKENDLSGSSGRVVSTAFKNVKRALPISLLTGLGKVIYDKGRINITMDGDVGPFTASATLHLQNGEITKTFEIKSKPSENSTLSETNNVVEIVIPPPNLFDSSVIIDLMELTLVFSDMSSDIEEKIMSDRINLLL